MGRNEGQDGAAQRCWGMDGRCAGTASSAKVPFSWESLGNGSASRHAHLGRQLGARRTHAQCHPAPCWDAYNPQISPRTKAGGQHGLCQPPAGSRSPPATPTPSFCQVTSGRGTPVTSQASTALALTITITMPGKGFKAGGSASGREALPTAGPPSWAKGAGSGTPGSRAYRAPRGGGVFGPCQRRSLPCRCSGRHVQAAPA